MKVHLRATGLAAGAVLAALALVGCGAPTTSSPASARQSVTQAIAALGSQPALGARITMGGSSDTVFVEVETGKGEALNSPGAVTDAADSFDAGVQVGTRVPFEVRFVGGSLYARAEPSQLPGAKATRFQSMLGRLDTYVPGLSALGQGGWVEASAASLHQLLSSIGQFASQLGITTPPTAGELETIVAQLQADLAKAVEANSTYRDLGTTGGRTHYSLSVHVRSFLDQLGPVLRSDLNVLPFGLGSIAASSIAKASSKIPANRTAVVDLYVAGGRLQEADMTVGGKALRVAFSTPPAVTAPAGATQLDLSKLPRILQQLGGSAAKGAL